MTKFDIIFISFMLTVTTIVCLAMGFLFYVMNDFMASQAKCDLVNICYY